MASVLNYLVLNLASACRARIIRHAAPAETHVDMVLNFRVLNLVFGLNARTESLQHMVPELGGMWAKLRNAKFISTLDSRHGFWQMGLHPKSRHKTSFHANMEHFNIAFCQWDF